MGSTIEPDTTAQPKPDELESIAETFIQDGHFLDYFYAVQRMIGFGIGRQTAKKIAVTLDGIDVRDENIISVRVDMVWNAVEAVLDSTKKMKFPHPPDFSSMTGYTITLPNLPSQARSNGVSRKNATVAKAI